MTATTILFVEIADWIISFQIRYILSDELYLYTLELTIRASIYTINQSVHWIIHRQSASILAHRHLVILLIYGCVGEVKLLLWLIMTKIHRMYALCWKVPLQLILSGRSDPINILVKILIAHWIIELSQS